MRNDITDPGPQNTDMAGTKRKFERTKPFYLDRWRYYFDDMPQEELADRMGTSKSRVSDVERGYNRYNETFLADAADALGREPWELISYDPTERQPFDKLWAQLTDAEREEAEDFLRYLLSKRRTVHSQEGAADLVDISGGRR